MATTVLYDPALNPDPFAFDYLGFLQLPTWPVYPSPPSQSVTDVFLPPNLLDSATEDASGITVNTNGSVFNGLPGFQPLPFFLNGALIPTLRTLSANANTGYAGFTNYTIDPADIDFGNIAGSLTLEQVNPDFPVLDPIAGFALSFDLRLLTESSAANRAGFSLLVVTNDPTKEIEIGFKTEGSDRVFAQLPNFGEGETSSGINLDFSVAQTYTLTVFNNAYTLAVGDTNILSGSLRNYNFNPATSNPPLPATANPYNVPNLIFFGDNTDQAFANFTLGAISLEDDLNIPIPEAVPLFFDYEQLLRYNNPAAVAPGNVINGIPLAQLFDEHYYLNKYGDVANAVFSGQIGSGYQHFITAGVAEGRNPSVLYDEAYYLATNGDVAQAVQSGAIASGLVHFLNSGHQELRNPSELFDQSDYLAINPDVAAAINPNGGLKSAFEHYIKFGADEFRLPLLSLYNEAFYLQVNPDVATAVQQGAFADGYEHFVRFGQRENRSPSLSYFEDLYLDLNNDVANAVGTGAFKSGFEHYERFGRFEGRLAFPTL